MAAQSDPGNRRESIPPPPGREPAFNIPVVVLVFIALCALIHLARTYMVSPTEDLAVLLRAAFIPLRYSGAYALDLYAFTSPLTYSLLHGGLAHLAINMIWLAAFGSPLANRIGARRFVLFWAATALAAAGLHYLIYPESPAPLVGASGAISGMMGAAARFGFQIDRSMPGRARFAGSVLPIRAVLRQRAVVTFLGVWMIINLATGLLSGGPGSSAVIAWEAHIGGFLVGFFAVRSFDRLPAPHGL
ncbi:rhomboid family intramembrane serine protease [Nitratireductor sp. CAU 1489]|uniref:Rhomboid family intramembrane serine protease n=1 Tax=Nitratireductor arenosus TaxID=2682096 RepID=A0A844QGI2_9HYPH|nr:rhomboid family intramembrane serine protease [Nitratireductor arenosus]MVA99066.1 rhomboid family intramembrane serine protease [Nitratireductor arenosus]